METGKKKRYDILDEIRGITLISMIIYHGVWDLVYIFGMNWKWYESDIAYIWQQSICWTFIFLSGFCFSLGKQKLKRGLMVFGAGLLVSIVTEVFMPEQRVRFGVLTLLGSCMLLFVLLDKIFRKVMPEIGIAISVAFFVLTRGINNGYLGFEGMRFVKLPMSLYEHGEVMTYLGFPYRGFYSTDYFSLLPWLFLFAAGYFFYRVLEKYKWMHKLECALPFGKPIRFIGKHSLIIYLLHQPVIYGILYLMF